MSNHSAAPDSTLTTPLMVTDLGAGTASAAVMPGWHIFADLTPPELAVERRVRRVRFGVIMALVLVAAGAFLGFDFARGQATATANDVATEEAISQSLRSQQQQFANVTALQITIDHARQELAALMSTDVDVDALVTKIWAALPAGMTIGQLALSVPPQTAGPAAGSRTDGAGAASLDTSTAAHIGIVTLAGTGVAIDDVPVFIDHLATIDGVYAPFPTSNQVDTEGGGTSFSVQFTLTDALLTNLYAAAEGGN